MNQPVSYHLMDYLEKQEELSSDAIFTRGLDRKIISWNRGAERMFGFTKDETIGNTITEIGYLKVTTEYIEEVEQILLENGFWESELHFFHKNGNKLYGAVTAHAIKNEEGKIISFLFIIKDISRIKQLENELKEANEALEAKVIIRTRELNAAKEIYQNIFDNSPMPMWIFEMSTYKFLDVNEIAIKKYGYSREEFLSMTILDITTEEYRNLLLASNAITTNPDISDRGIWKHRLKDGGIIDVEIVAHDIKVKNVKSRLVLANDVTKRIAAEKKLEANEKLFRALIENSHDGKVLLDKDFKIIYRSPSAATISGWTDEELLSGNVEVHIHPEDKEVVLNALNESLQFPNKLIPVTNRNLHKDGQYRWMEGTVRNMLHDENIRAIVFNYRDVTERKAAEEKLNANEKRFRALIENSHDGITLMNENGTVLYRSPSTERITGWTEEDMKGKNANINAHPDDLGKLQQISELLSNEPGKVFPLTFRNKHKDGTYRWVTGTIVNLLNDENVRAVVYNYKDITETKEAEQKLRESEYQLRYSLDNMIEGVQIVDHNWRYTYVNDALVKDSKYSREELIGYTMMEKYPGIETTPMFAELTSCMQERRKGFLENEFTFPDGTKQYFELSFQPIPEGIFILSLNVTDRILAMQQLATSELRFRTLIEYGDDIVTLFDKDFNVTYRSPTSERITGWTDEDMMGQSGAKHIHPDDLEYAGRIIQKILANPGITEPVSVRLLHKKGHYIIIEGIISNLIDNRNINAIVFNYRDVTDKRNALDKLASSELRFRTLLENGNDIVSMFDENFSIIYRSPSAYKVMGWPDEQMMGEVGTKNIHPEDLLEARNQIQFIKENPGIAIDVFLRMKHQSGHYLWVEGKLINLLHDKNIQAIVFNFRDVTDRKIAIDELSASEKQFRNLVERISDGFLTLDNDLCITYLNSVAEKMFNVSPGYLIGKKMYDEYSSGIGGKIYTAIHTAIQSNEPQRIDSYSDIFNRWITGSIYPSETGLTCFFRDSTEVRKLEIELQQQQRREQTKLISAALEAQEKERNAIGLELHDNVNQILVGTTMFLSMVKKSPVKDDALITECIDHIKEAINENRKIAHVLVGPDLENKHINDQIKALSENMLVPNGIEPIYDFENCDYTLISKEKKVALYRITQEVFTNILKYAAATEVQILLTTNMNSVVRMSISDNGVGMQEKQLLAGIGLRNIRSRLVVLDGSMKINTAPGKGFTLEVEIPLDN